MISKVFNRSIIAPARFVGMKPQGVFRFSQKVWKDRDDAAEKVYITQSQKLAMKKLLEKMNDQGFENTSKQELFEKNLNQILSKHKVNNEAFKVEIIHLHKQL